MGGECDSKAIVGAAHGYELGEPLRYDEIFGRSVGACVFQSNPKLYDMAAAVRSSLTR